MAMMTMEEWIKIYNDQTREKFNEDLYRRDDMAVIESLKKVILSCQRDSYFTIRVDNFTVVEDYEEIIKILYDHEQEKIDKNKNNSAKIPNPYSFIDTKSSAIMLLIVDYYLAINDPENPEQDTLRVLIKVPRIVDKYYYKINGNLYSAIFQIVDGSTYNNTNSSSKKQSITFKTIFMPTRIYRNVYKITDYAGNEIKYTMYTSRIFNKNIPIAEYFFGKFGFYGALQFLGLQDVIYIDNQYIDRPDCYTFNKEDVFIQVPKIIFDADYSVQCIAMTIYRHVNFKFTFKDIITRKFWLENLAIRLNSKPSEEKGLSVLESLESIYDIETYESLRLPYEHKKDIYCVLRWLMREFPNLRLKDNADISTKRIRREPYISAMYSTKMSRGIYRISDIQKKITMDEIRRFIYISPDYLIDKMSKDKLVTFKNGSNDNDGIDALKFSYKGVSGLGDSESGKNSTIPDSYRHIHPSHIGRVDLDTSSATDPGLTGLICPLAKTNNGSFADPDFLEPCSWQETFDELVNQYNSTKRRMQLVSFQDEILGDLLDKADKVANKNKSVVTKENLNYANQVQKVALVTFNQADYGEYYESDYLDADITTSIFKYDDNGNEIPTDYEPAVIVYKH